jgi:hypothetical protein
MKYLKYFESNKSIDAICKKYGIKNYNINQDGTVDVNGNVNLSDCGLKELPLKFGYVSHSFYCINNELMFLQGSPREVGGDFGCGFNRLTSLQGGPKSVGGDFGCIHNQLKSLMGAPEIVYGSFYCGYNSQLTSLAGAPKEIIGDFICEGISNLPEEIKDNKKYINKIVKYQNDYNIWRRDGSLDKYRFSDMMKEILEEEASR